MANSGRRQAVESAKEETTAGVQQSGLIFSQIDSEDNFSAHTQCPLACTV